MTIKIKRVYDPRDAADGERILVDRLWPRGVSKEKAELSLWLKEIAPSASLRVWFGHDPDKWSGFRRRYIAELLNRKDLVELLANKAEIGTITLVYAARDQRHNEAVVLKEVLESLTSLS